MSKGIYIGNKTVKKKKSQRLLTKTDYHKSWNSSCFWREEEGCGLKGKHRELLFCCQCLVSWPGWWLHLHSCYGIKLHICVSCTIHIVISPKVIWIEHRRGINFEKELKHFFLWNGQKWGKDEWKYKYNVNWREESCVFPER